MKKSKITLTALRPEDHEAAARLLHGSLVHWYESRLNQGARFGDSPEPFRLFPEVYEALDPGQAIAARNETASFSASVSSTRAKPISRWASSPPRPRPPAAALRVR